MVNFYHQQYLDGVLFLGDCNARHCLWGDSLCNPNGYLLLESLSAGGNILNNGEKTFLSSNGSSIIDLCIVIGKIAKQVGFELTTDPNIELFRGAPQRGHIPSIVKCNLNRTTEEGNTKPWLQKADWEAWQNALEESSHASLEAVQCPSAIDQWGSVLVDITGATRLAILIKEAPGIANLSGLKIYLKKVRNSEFSEKNSSTAPTTQMEKDLIMQKMSLRAFYLRNRRGECEKL